jgi:hypothetical protein
LARLLDGSRDFPAYAVQQTLFPATSDLLGDGRRFSLSPGERAGVRAGVPQNIFGKNNSPKSHCDLAGLLIEFKIN